MAEPEPVKPPDKVNDQDNGTEQPMEESSSDAAIMPAQSYAAAAAAENTDNEKVVDVRRIVVKKTKTKEKAKLVFMSLGIPRTHVGTISELFFTPELHGVGGAVENGSLYHSSYEDAIEL